MGYRDNVLALTEALGGAPYTFHREDGFYPLTLETDQEAIENAECNPGTLKVVNEISGMTVWQNEPWECKDPALADWPIWAQRVGSVTITAYDLAMLPEYSVTLPDSYKRPISEGGRPWKRDLNVRGKFGTGRKWVRCEYIAHQTPGLIGIKTERIEIR